MRADQNIALAAECFNQANQIQHGIMILVDATSGPNPEGLAESVMQRIRELFQRLYRFHRNRGSDEREERFQVNVQNMEKLDETLNGWKICLEVMLAQIQCLGKAVS